MKKVYVFFADGFEEIEAMAPVDILRRAGLQVVMVSVTDDEIVKGAHGVSMMQMPPSPLRRKTLCANLSLPLVRTIRI